MYGLLSLSPNGGEAERTAAIFAKAEARQLLRILWGGGAGMSRWAMRTSRCDGRVRRWRGLGKHPFGLRGSHSQS